MTNELKLRTVVLEDEDIIRENLISKLKKFDELEIIGEAVSVNEAFNLIVREKPDAAFMDIKLIGGDAFTLLSRLKDQSIDLPYIVITTGFPEYVMTALNDYRNYIVQYLLKPYNEGWQEKIRKSVDALLLSHLKKNAPAKTVTNTAGVSISDHNYTFINNKKNFTRIDFDKIIYLESAGSGATYIVTDKDTTRIDCTIVKCLEEIFPENFIRISKSNAVNKDKIIRINRDDRTLDIMLGDKEKSLGIGEVYYGELIKQVVV